MGKKQALIATAHPDDESIFFSGLIMNHPEIDWHVYCVTDGNADGNGEVRADQFKRACQMLGVKECEILGHPDIYEQRLDIDKLSSDLKQFGKADYVFTHGVLGEYGHPHHQDVCMAANETFKGHNNLLSIAYNCLPEKIVTLTEQQYEIKTKILADIYHAETRRFVNFIQAYWFEGFTQVSEAEVRELYSYFVTGKNPKLELLDKFKWYWPYLEHNGGQVAPRPF
ncbi:MAG: PIG-L family deacetylase [Bacteriovoracaceae bacterium]|nr:PIG-L family deacetylase [Bacteriovoracaceae bacterium]